MSYMVLDKKDNNYMVKVGMSRNLQKRINDYKSHNPLAIVICSCAGTEREEKYCHNMLSQVYQRIKGTEWFLVDEKFYYDCMSFGFRIFPKFMKNKIVWYNK